MEKTINSKLIFDGGVIKVYVDDVELDNGNYEKREIVHHRGGVCIALKDDENHYFMVRQYRYAFNDYLYEFPAGKLEENEDISTAIVREALEETGTTVKNLQYLHYTIPTCGYSNEKIHLFYGEVDQHHQQNLEAGEDITLYRFTLDEILLMIENNGILDAKTQILAYKLNCIK